MSEDGLISSQNVVRIGPGQTFLSEWNERVHKIQGRCSKVRPHGKNIVLLRRIVFLCNFFSLYVLS